MVKKLILLVNLGSPKNPTKKEIRKFLLEFLLDRRVVDLPRWFWYPLLRLVIIPLRIKRLIKEYSEIFALYNQAPLHYYSQVQATKLQAKLEPDLKVLNAYTYGENNLSKRLTEALLFKPQEIVIVPLYPQFSSATTLSIWDGLAQFYINKYNLPNIKFVHGFCNQPEYVKAVVNKINNYWRLNKKAQKLIFSFHSLPQEIIDLGDPYYQECQTSFILFLNYLGLTTQKASIAFQSKFGRKAWLAPSTKEVIEVYAKAGIKTIDIIAPGFVFDCLETLIEIKRDYQAYFLSLGGEELNYIEALNDSEDLTKLLYNLIIC